MSEILWVTPAKYDQHILNEIQAIIRRYESRFKPNESKFNERSTGQGLIEPLLELLGWKIRDVDEVYPEYFVSGSGRVDYVLKLNKIPVVYIEIKKVSESLDGSRGGSSYADQAMDYAWKQRATWAVLTNFKELRLYNAKERILVIKVKYEEYTSNFGGTLRYLTKNAISKGELGQLYAYKAGKEIDETFLKDLQKWRLNIANDIHRMNSLGINQISSQTQKILNRLILIRIAEDRGALPRGSLQNEYTKWKTTIRSKRKGFVEELRELFLDFEFDFNTELFKQDICDTILISDSIFENLINTLYSYDFSTLTGDILGSTYELYLGYSLEPIDKDYIEQKIVPHDIPLELVMKREYRQRKGIFYTRPSVVDFIVSKTVISMLKLKETESIKSLKILDTSGGSGSFQIKTLIALRNNLLKEVLKARTRLKHNSQFQTKLAQMTIDDIPNVILKNNLYLVDLDPHAVEIAKLNLWAQALHPKYNSEKVLVELDKHIMCGNSLVSGTKEELTRYFTENEIDADIKPFNWKEKFNNIFSINEGFDIIIGNPPYYSVHYLSDSMKDYLEAQYSCIHTGQNDIHYYFYYRGIDLLKENGLLGFITARYFIEARDASKFREWILNNCIIKLIIDFGNIDMFGGLGTRTAVMVLEKYTGSEKSEGRKENYIQVAKVKCRRWMKSKRELVKLIDNNINPKGGLYEDTYIKSFSMKQSELTSDAWVLISDKEKYLKNKIECLSIPLEELCYCGKGMETGLNEVKKNGKRIGVYHLTKAEVDELKIEPDLLQKLIKNSDIDRYFLDYRELYLLYLTDEHNISNYPNAEKHLNRFKQDLSQRYGFDSEQRKWYAMSVARNKELFDDASEKLICPYISSENKFAYDDCSPKQKYYGMTDTTIVVPKKNGTVNFKFILAVLNSSLSNFYYRTYAKSKDYRYEYFSETISKIRIPDLKKGGSETARIKEDLVELTTTMIELSAQKNDIQKTFSSVLKNNLVDITCKFKEYYENALTYSFKKNVLMNNDPIVESCEIQLSQDEDLIRVRAYFDENWHDVMNLKFEDSYMRDFIYISLDKFLIENITKVVWRKGKLISDIILNLDVPKIITNHAANKKRIEMIMAELKSTIGTRNLGIIVETLRDSNDQIDKKIYELYRLDESDIEILENSIDYNRPYLRY